MARQADYGNQYFENIIDLYLAQLKNKDNIKKRKKKLAGLYMARQMIAEYAAQENIKDICLG